MVVCANIKSVCQIDIESDEAFRILCETLHMKSVLDEDTKFIVKKNEDGENNLYAIKDGVEYHYDDRGDLFVALRNVAVNMFPNTSFRSDDYIYNSENTKHGHWTLLDECSNAGVYCSNCHKNVYKTDYANQKIKSKYCPNCGSIMDEEFEVV